MARTPRMLSNHHGCHNNDLKPRSMNFITSISIQIARQASWRKHNTCHVGAFDLLMTTSFIHSHSSSQKPGVRQQSKSIATAPRYPKMCRFGGSKLNKRARKTQVFLPVCAAFDQLSSWASRGGGGYRLYPPLSQMRNNVLYSITL